MLDITILVSFFAYLQNIILLIYKHVPYYYFSFNHNQVFVNAHYFQQSVNIIWFVH
jgi:hypothetical protein